MALELFEVESGFVVDGSSRIAGTVDPGSAGGLPDEVGVGSIYENTSNGELWIKVTAGTGIDKWKRMATEQFVNDLFATGSSWREPVEVHDDVSTVLPTETPGNPITVDGVSITDGQRVLFGNLTGGDGRNVYEYDQAAGTFSETPNNETDGDTVYVIGGTDAGKVYHYNGSDWVLINQSSVDELGFIRSFIGKDGTGSETPTYSSANQITQNNDLEGAIGELDTAIGDDVSPNVRTKSPLSGLNDVNANLEGLDDAIGSDADFTPLTRTTGSTSLANSVYSNLDALDLAIGADSHLTPSTRTVGPVAVTQSVYQMVDALDSAIGNDVTPLSRTLGAISASSSVNANLDALDTVVGQDSELTPVTRTLGQMSLSSSIYANLDDLDAVVGPDADMVSTVNISTASSIYANLSGLDTTLDLAYHIVTDKTGVTADTLLDEVSVDDYCTVTWEICAEGNLAADAAKKYIAKVHAAHDGHNKGGGADATDTDKDVHSILKLGASLGISLSVVLSGVGPAQTMQLRATASTASDFRIRRTEAIKMV